MDFALKQMSPQLQVTNMEQAIEFYTNKLGFELEFRYEDFYAGIIKDGYSIHLKLTDLPTEQKSQHSDDDPIFITFSVDDIKDLYEELSSRSLTFIQPLRQMPYGKEFYTSDLDGNVLAFLDIGE